MEAAFNNGRKSIPERVQAAIKHLPAEPMTDAEGSGAYRLFIVERTLENLLSAWGNGSLEGGNA